MKKFIFFLVFILILTLVFFENWGERFPIDHIGETAKSLVATLGIREGEAFGDDEQEVLGFINEERSRRNLSELSADVLLDEAARDIAVHMLNKGKIEFDSKDMESLGAQLRERGFLYVSIAVNFATGIRKEDVHAKLMENGENRDIILNELFTHSGMCVLKSNHFGKIWVELFAQKVPDVIEILEDEERHMLQLVNEEREMNKLPPLKLDARLVELARLKSRDIAEKDYFDHISPTYGSPFDMLKRFGIRYRMAAENLAGHQTVDLAHQGLMNSEGHRKNILTREFTHIGIGVVRGSKYGKVYTQLFIEK